jgi:hypothetical protein
MRRTVAIACLGDGRSRRATPSGDALRRGGRARGASQRTAAIRLLAVHPADAAVRSADVQAEHSARARRHSDEAVYRRRARSPRSYHHTFRASGAPTASALYSRRRDDRRLSAARSKEVSLNGSAAAMHGLLLESLPTLISLPYTAVGPNLSETLVVVLAGPRLGGAAGLAKNCTGPVGPFGSSAPNALVASPLTGCPSMVASWASWLRTTPAYSPSADYDTACGQMDRPRLSLSDVTLSTRAAVGTDHRVIASRQSQGSTQVVPVCP